jgi:cytochrome c553
MAPFSNLPVLMPKQSFTVLLRAMLVHSALIATSIAAPSQHALPARDDIAQRVLACVACHGKQGQASADGYFPRIAGKPSGYLYNQLLNFREGRRSYPAMSYLVAHLSNDYLREMADYFSALQPPYSLPASPKGSAQALARGRQLAREGERAPNIPACVSCHGARLTGVLPAIPGLLGLPQDYIVAQIGAWRTGARHAASPDCMLDVSRRMTADDIGAVAAWLASQPMPVETSPAPFLILPVECGTAP